MVKRIILIPIGFIVLGLITAFLLSVRYEMSYMVRPTAQKALALGQYHFDSARPDAYDIDVAERYLREAYALDPKYPYVNHELARIEFLRGNFREALDLIDAEIDLQGETFPNAFYIRGLIEGYMGSYHSAVLDYAVYLKHDPKNWAALNDYAWVLLKAGRIEDAEDVTADGVTWFPNNPWLLNSRTIALYEMGDFEGSAIAATRATDAMESVGTEDWLRAYPGNDPRKANEGVRALRDAITENMHRATEAYAITALQ